MRFTAALVVLAGCVQGFTKSPKPDDPPSDLAGSTHGVPGETIEYQAAFRGMTVGRLVVSVGQRGVVDGRPAIIVKSSATSAGFASLFTDVRWELTTTLDTTTGLPIHEIDETWFKEDGKPEHRRTEREWSHDTEFNLHAAAGVLRGWQSQEGERAEIDVLIDRKQVHAQLWDAARESLPGAQGLAVRYDGIAMDKYNFSVWISDDEARVPILMRTDTKLGSMTVEMVRYDPPRDP